MLRWPADASQLSGARRAGMLFVTAALALIGWATLSPRGGGPGALQLAPYCIWCGDARLTDAAANVVLFIPLGLGLVAAGMRASRAAACCMAVTVAIELLQLVSLPAGRVASVSDVVTNGAGGIAGAALAHHAQALLQPRRSLASTLALSWSAVACAIVACSAWALSMPASRADALDGDRPTPVQDREARLSPLPFTPGYGWFAGTVVGVIVDGIELPHRGTGPAIVQSPVLPRHIVHVAVVGRDRRESSIPMLYLHEPREFRSTLVLSQRGSSVVLHAPTRGEQLGLVAPDLILRDVFPPTRAFTDTAVFTGRTSGAALELEVEQRGRRQLATMRRSPALGWSLIQSLVPAGHRLAPLLSAFWMACLAFPAAYWAWWSRQHRATVMLTAFGLLSLCLLVSVRYFDIAGIEAPGWYALVAGAALGMLAGNVSLAGRRKNSA